MKLIVFPGNPGRQYEKTRHNLPWMVLENHAKRNNLIWKKKFNALWCKSHEGKAILLKPETFVNNTGQSVQPAAAFFKIPPDDIMVLHDEIELPFGKILLKHGGGAGGHNGLRSIIHSLGTNSFPRMRLGVSRPSRGDVASYVLGRFSPEEEAELPDFINNAEETLSEWLFKSS